MSVFTYSGIIISLAALISYLNHRFIKMQPTIAVLISANIISIILVTLANIGWLTPHQNIATFVNKLDFQNLIMNFMLGLLLFAGSLSIDISQLKKHKLEIALLTCLSTVLSTAIIAILAYLILQAFHSDVSFMYCLLFGSLISPTDPIAVLAIFKELKAPKNLETIVSAEALFNDGVGIVLFITFFSLVFNHHSPTFSSVSILFLQETIGGVLYGLLLGWVGYQLLKPIHDSKLEILVTLAIATGGYTLAQKLGISGPLAMVVAGIFIGNYHATPNKSAKRIELKHFWELIDEVLNIILFLLLGLELLAVDFHSWLVLAGLSMILVVLLSRLITVSIPILFLRSWREPLPYATRILTWGGLRGGLALALALSLPSDENRAIIISITYAVVLFSVIVQGTSIKWLVKKIV